MGSAFDLIVTADTPSRRAELRLLDAAGTQLAFRHTDFSILPVSRLQGLFDLRNYLRHYVEREKEEAAVAEVGVSIAEQVLGAEIFKLLWASESQRSLCIQLPGATEEENVLAAALARVPWEIARPVPSEPTLAERNLLVRVVHDRAGSASQPLELGKDEALRVLFVFAESRGSRPLAARKERRELARLFEQEIYPHRRIEADFLAHGVTRERLREQIEDRGGYHVVHWSGHGHLNLLELAKPGGRQDLLSGEALLDLFTEAGGFIPRIFFLSACHSGDILRVKDWNDFLAAAKGKEPGTKEASPEPPKDVAIPEASGFTGTAHALLAGGVRSVVAMRYEVGDEYARELALDFYEALLADSKPKSVAAALTSARRKLRDEKSHAKGRFAACDHATPLLYGEEDLNLTLPQGRSLALDGRNRRLHAITELTLTQHEHFVGRTWELAGLGAEFIGAKRGENVKPVAVITGLGGMGKTALVAEALSLWERRFEWVLLYQAKPNPLSFEGTLRDIHLKLNAELGRYHDHVTGRPADAIYRQADADFTGEERMERLTMNLLRALKDEAILLVLDNFETCLKPTAEQGDSSNPLWACQDPAWDRCLARLATELVGSPSRLLITCRKPLAALAGTEFHPVLLGPLPASEAQLYVREHAGLSAMIFGSDEKERDLAVRLLNASRFHPLLMYHLARLATGGPALRPRLMEALAALEAKQGFAKLPELFSVKPGDAKELAYLDDALETSIDQLIESSGPDARRLLWVISLANQPEALGLVRRVWGGESVETQQLRELAAMLANLEQLPPELREQLRSMPPKLRAMLEALPPEPNLPGLEPLLAQLVAVGLVAEERMGPEDSNPNLTCHELVRDRVWAWVERHPEQRGGRSENEVRDAFAEHLADTFEALQHQDMALALEAGSRAIVYCVQAQAWERLGGFASRLVTSAGGAPFLERLTPYLQVAAEAAPPGRRKWQFLGSVADALMLQGQPHASLPWYEQASALARAAAEEDGKEAIVAWADVGAIAGNLAGALLNVGRAEASRQQQLESVEAKKRAGAPAMLILGSELEILRINIERGLAAVALPEVEARLEQLESWWHQHCAGERVPEVFDTEVLVRALLTALNIAGQAHSDSKAWPRALRHLEFALQLELQIGQPEEAIAATRVNRANVLIHLKRFNEARAELEGCLQLFQGNWGRCASIRSLLAVLSYKQSDIEQAIVQERRALALRDQEQDPKERAISHNNLANFLGRSGSAALVAESSRHQLAALAYRLVAGLGQHLQTSFLSYVVCFHRAHAAGMGLPVPSLAELLTGPAFRPLEEWLREQREDLVELQAALDEILEQARQVALSKNPPNPS